MYSEEGEEEEGEEEDKDEPEKLITVAMWVSGRHHQGIMPEIEIDDSGMHYIIGRVLDNEPIKREFTYHFAVSFEKLILEVSGRVNQD